MAKLGSHIVIGPRNGYGLLCEANQAVALSVGDGGALTEAKQKSGGYTYTIYRHTLYADSPPGIDQTTPEGARSMADYWYPQLKSRWLANSADYYVSINEPGGHDLSVIPNYVAYESRMIDLAAVDGFKLCVLNLAWGTPDDGAASGGQPNGGIEVWKTHYVPVIRKAFEKGGIYGRHGYGQFGDLSSQRPFQEAAYLRSVGLNGGMVITELGVNAGDTFPGISEFMTMATNFDVEMRKHSNIIGGCLWTLGDWAQANWQAAIPDMTAYLLANPTPKWTPGTVPPPTLPKIVIVKKPQKTQMTEAENAAANGYAWTNYGRTTTHSIDDMIRMLSGGNADSYAVLAYPDRTSQAEAKLALLAGGYRWIEWPETVPPPSMPQITVTPISQRDPRWATIDMGGDGKTIGSWGCLLVAYNIFANYLKLTNELPPAHMTRMKNAGAMTGPYLLPAALRTAFPNDINYLGYEGQGDSLNARIRASIDRGYPVPVRVDFNPATGQAEQHWVLITGYTATDFWCADPWYGDAVLLSTRYNITGNDVLEGIFYERKAAATGLDMAKYFLPATGNYGQLFMLKNNWGAGDERCQLQSESNVSFVTKNQQYEKRTIDASFISLELDTSPGNGEYYTVTGNWLPRRMSPGQTFTRTETIIFRYKNNCQPVPSKPAYTSTTNITFDKRHIGWTCPESEIVLSDVAELSWFSGGRVDERYWFAAGLGLVRWEKYTGHKSWIHELIPVGSQGNNVKEVGCFS